MANKLVWRMVQALPIVVLASLIIFLLNFVIPGDPIVLMLGEDYDPEVAQAVRKELGLDRSLVVQYAHWLARVLKGDLGRSIYFGVPVSHLIRTRLEPTVTLAFLSFLLATLIGLVAGILSAYYYNSPADRILMLTAVLGVALPHFVLGVLLILAFSVGFGLFPTSGFQSLSSGNWWEAVRHLTLPVITLGTGQGAIIARMTRAYFLETLGSDYVRTARAKGLAPTSILMKHALRNALVPLLAVIGVSLSVLLGGAVVTETVFAIPGVGRLLVSSISTRDYPVVMGVILVITLVYVAINLALDLVNTVVDPRVKD